jgi:hypothetical protein
MAYTTIDKPDDYFNTLTYTGNNSLANSITGVGFQPDFVWIKRRSGDTNDNVLFDAVRGATKRLISNATSAETTNTDTLSAFNTDGFTVNINDTVNASSPYVAWNWLGANSTASNTAGSITSTVSANTTSGFSIVSYTGTGTAGATIGHGLGVAPSLIITKARANAGRFWGVYSESLGNTGVMALNSTQAFDISTTYWNDTTPSSSFFTVGTNGDTNSASGMIAYCFAEKQGYSKFGSYTGNGSTDGTFVYTGFKPAFVMAKRTDSTSGWGMYDNKRGPFNVMDVRLLANTDGADDTSSDNNLDFLSNGFKWRTASGWNASASYIYMAFAENPFVTSTSIPTTAR